VKLRALGSTGLLVSPIGLGLAALGRPAYITTDRQRDIGDDRSVEALERRCHEMLDAAYACGIRYLDAARSYGLAETFLANWLNARQLPEDALTVASKWGYTYTGEWRMDAPIHEVKDLSVEALRRQHAESLSLLGRRLRLYQIHSATLESGVLDDRRVLGELARLRSDGLAIGLTVTGPMQADIIRRAMDVQVDGVNPFQTVQATWNLLETSAGPALADAHDRGWGVALKEVLANGRLAGQQDAAFAAAVSQPWADVVLSGAVTAGQLQNNVRALEISEVAGRADDSPPMAQPPERYWNDRRALKWE
jgi:aryl-alcohol dehydrogenase-like predicted oxidoreductase